jgi:hypothetical protein
MVTGSGMCEMTVSKERSSEDMAERTSLGKLLPAGASVQRLATMDLVQGEKNRERGRRKRLGAKRIFHRSSLSLKARNEYFIGCSIY